MTSRAYALIYALFLLVLISYFVSSLRQNDGIKLDRIANSHIHFQSLLHIQSLDKIARIYATKQKPHASLTGRFDFGGGYVGGFEIVGKRAFLYVEAQNKRTSQILRQTKEITLKGI